MPSKRKKAVRKYPPDVTVDPYGPRLIPIPNEHRPTEANSLRWASLGAEALSVWDKAAKPKEPEPKAKAKSAGTGNSAK